MNDKKEEKGRSDDGVMIDGSWYVRPGGVVEDRVSAGGVVLRWVGGEKEGRWEVALAREGDFASYVLPKGGVEKGETLVEAAKREIEEEAGLTGLELVGELGVRERLSFNRKRWVKTHYFLFVTKEEGGEPADVKRHYHRARWFGVGELPAMLWPEQRALVEKDWGKMMKMIEGRGR